MKRGFGLLDVVFATAVLFLIGLFVLNLFPGSLLAISSTRNRLHAANLCRSEMSAARHTSLSQLEFGTFERTVSADGTDFLIRREVYPVEERNPELIRGVKVTVVWQVRNKAREVSLESYLSAARR